MDSYSFRRKLLRFDRPETPEYHVSNIPKFYSNHLDWDKMYVAGPKLADSCYPILYEEHVGGDCGATSGCVCHGACGSGCDCGCQDSLPRNTRLLLILLILAVTLVIKARSQ